MWSMFAIGAAYMSLSDAQYRRFGTYIRRKATTLVGIPKVFAAVVLAAAPIGVGLLCGVVLYDYRLRTNKDFRRLIIKVMLSLFVANCKAIIPCEMSVSNQNIFYPYVLTRPFCAPLPPTPFRIFLFELFVLFSKLGSSIVP